MGQSRPLPLPHRPVRAAQAWGGAGPVPARPVGSGRAVLPRGQVQSGIEDLRSGRGPGPRALLATVSQCDPLSDLPTTKPCRGPGGGSGRHGQRLDQEKGADRVKTPRHRRILFSRLRPDRPRGAACRVAGV